MPAVVFSFHFNNMIPGRLVRRRAERLSVFDPVAAVCLGLVQGCISLLQQGLRRLTAPGDGDRYPKAARDGNGWPVRHIDRRRGDNAVQLLDAAPAALHIKVRQQNDELSPP